ncbi:hypothetical protein N7447_002955 [Penicillium robsamsonii]|uniref:uncharacterized protein n=1 Tax=Penicillium robsamsonii TaxID=1792511 RepID=UPI002548ED41|nr:uncharacterized protein N7447_002955 [Penicillium robsamsonii]KAJ5836929.1 hypothetical protein N7447_002955 [Penicillium robsamsonii]
MIASQAAILLAKKSTTTFESNSVPSPWANNGMAGTVSSAGLLPVVMDAGSSVSSVQLVKKRNERAASRVLPEQLVSSTLNFTI